MNPAHLENVIGEVSSATSDQALNALEIAHSAFAKWQNVSAEERAKCLEKAADLLEERMKELIYILIVEAGKILSDAIAEVREAIDFLRYYAMIAKNELSDWKKLPGPTGEDNFIFLKAEEFSYAYHRGIFRSLSSLGRSQLHLQQVMQCWQNRQSKRRLLPTKLLRYYMKLGYQRMCYTSFLGMVDI